MRTRQQAPTDVGDSISTDAPPDGSAPRAHPKDPLHGVTLQRVIEQLHARYG